MDDEKVAVTVRLKGARGKTITAKVPKPVADALREQAQPIRGRVAPLRVTASYTLYYEVAAVEGGVEKAVATGRVAADASATRFYEVEAVVAIGDEELAIEPPMEPAERRAQFRVVGSDRPPRNRR